MISSPIPTKRSNGWTPERRLKQSQSIRRWSPWKKSTGPRTGAGKKRIALNALKHGRRAAMCAEDRVVKDCLRAHARFLNRVETFIRVARKLDKAGIPYTQSGLWHALYPTAETKISTNKLMDSPARLNATPSSLHPGYLGKGRYLSVIRHKTTAFDGMIRKLQSAWGAPFSYRLTSPPKRGIYSSCKNMGSYKW